MSEWRELKLSEIAGLRREGFKPDQLHTLPYIGLEHIEAKGLRLNSIGNSTEVTSQKSKFFPNDILYGKLRPYFQKVYNPSFEGVCSTDIFVIKAKKEIDSKFLFYLIASDEFTNLANNGSTGTRMPRADWKHLSSTFWNIPDLPTQKAIAEILSSLDDKIELNNQINQNLEALVQALFKKWFVDFEFPNENGEPYKSSGGEMIDSELGEIPKGWRIKLVNELNPKLETGKRPKGGVNGIDSGTPSVGAESIKGLGYFEYSKTKFVSKEFSSLMKKGWVNGFEILIYKDGGKPGTFIPNFNMFGEGFPFEKLVLNEHVFLLDFGSKDQNCFGYFFFDSDYVRPILANSGGKAAIPGINQGDINSLKIFDFEIPEVKKFGEVSQSIISSILKNCKENENLRNLRDTLLPKLISGELEVSEASLESTF